MEIRRVQKFQPERPGFYYPLLNHLAQSPLHYTQPHELTSIPSHATASSLAYTKYFSKPNLHPDPNGTLQSAPLFLETLEIVMKNNIFSFADSYWLQLCGTAMGTPVACAYATITYGHFENTVILPNYSANLLFYRRYIDDIFGIWLQSPNNTSTWRNFKSDLNKWGNLKLEIEELSRQTHFLDLNISIVNSSISFSTYQKPLNLYLYIPPSSAHPTSCLKGLIKGELQRYWSQNATKDFEDLATKFIERLHARGHSLSNLQHILLQAASSLDKTQATTQLKKNNDSNSTLFLHWIHHPKDLQRQDIRHMYESILQPHTPHERMLVAISRPRNLRDVLTKAALTLPDHLNLQELIQLNNTQTT
jgi:hypothetical protein